MVRLGTNKKPIRFRVQTKDRLMQISTLCDQNGWIFVGGLEPDKPEDLSEVEYLLNPKAFASQPRMGSADAMTYMREQPKIGRNELCPCGSGRKYKKCCLQE